MCFIYFPKFTETLSFNFKIISKNKRKNLTFFRQIGKLNKGSVLTSHQKKFDEIQQNPIFRITFWPNFCVFGQTKNLVNVFSDFPEL